MLAVELEGALRVEAGYEPILAALGDAGRLEEGMRLGRLVSCARGELERALGVTCCRIPIAADLIAARAPLIGVGGEQCARARGVLVEVECPCEKRGRGRDIGALECDTAAPVEDLRPIGSVEPRRLRADLGVLEQLVCILHRT